VVRSPQAPELSTDFSSYPSVTHKGCPDPNQQLPLGIQPSFNNSTAPYYD
jgi:hypothetical protein